MTDTFADVADTASHLAAMSYGRVLRWAGGDLHWLRLVQQARDYKPGWVFKVLQESAAS